MVPRLTQGERSIVKKTIVVNLDYTGQEKIRVDESSRSSPDIPDVELVRHSKSEREITQRAHQGLS